MHPNSSTSIYKASAISYKRENPRVTERVGGWWLKNPLTSTDGLCRQKLNKEHVLNDITDQIDLIDVYRTFYLKSVE